jgi:hypothetical protein
MMTDLNSKAMRKARRAILDKFEDEPFLNFNDIVAAARPFIEVDGDCSMVPSLRRTLIMWTDLSGELIDLINSMMKDGELIPNFSSPIWYTGERSPNYPLAATAGDKTYDEPHWAPVVFGKDMTTPEEAMEILVRSEVM